MAVPVPKVRLLLLLGAGVALLAGLNAALLRLGLNAPIDSASLANQHGLLMLYGFLGTAILLERAVALHSGCRGFTWWGYLAPAASVIAVVLVLVTSGTGGLPGGNLLAAEFWIFGYGLLIAIYTVIWGRQKSFYLLIQIFGALAGLVGIVLWGAGWPIWDVFPWWAAFLVLTIVGERLELARIAFSTGAVEARVFLESVAYLMFITLSMFNPAVGYPLMGLALGVLMLDMGLHDIARRTINSPGLAKFAAASMLAAYFWALVAAVIWVVLGPVTTGFGYDAVVHCLTVGFALSMVLAHAPIIIPAVVRREVPYSPVMWAVWGLLQVGLLLRLAFGARAGLNEPGGFLGWQFGGALDVFAVLAFVITTLTLVLLSGRRKKNRGVAPGKERATPVSEVAVSAVEGNK